MSKFKVGDIVECIDDIGDLGEIMAASVESNRYTIKWDSCDCEISWHDDGKLRLASEAPESSTKPSDTVTLPITFTNGMDFLEGEFEANNEVYEVIIRKKVKGR